MSVLIYSQHATTLGFFATCNTVWVRYNISIRYNFIFLTSLRFFFQNHILSTSSLISLILKEHQQDFFIVLTRYLGFTWWVKSKWKKNKDQILLSPQLSCLRLLSRTLSFHQHFWLILFRFLPILKIYFFNICFQEHFFVQEFFFHSY